MQDNWVDFKAVKETVTMKMLLDRYQINWLRKSGKELRGRCPIHKGDGQDAFNVNLTKNAFTCFSCQARGNVLDFVAVMEKCSVRDAALKLQGWYSIPVSTPEVTKAKPVEKGTGEPVVNKPLTFQLKGIDSAHPYLASRGISKETAETFGIGFFGGKGSMQGRVVIPIHNAVGELVAYAGRSIDASEPRYKLPVGFHKSIELFNLHRAIAKTPAGDCATVVLVEGFFDCMKVSQAGFACVALMGCSLSQEQHELLGRHFGRVVLMLDGDEAGRAATLEISGRLLHSHWIRTVSLIQGIQPDQISIEKLRLAIGSM